MSTAIELVTKKPSEICHSVDYSVFFVTVDWLLGSIFDVVQELNTNYSIEQSELALVALNARKLSDICNELINKSSSN